jgi:hypothetical protein
VRTQPAKAEAKALWQLQGSEAPLPRDVKLAAGETLVPNLVGRPARLALVQGREAMLEVALTGSGVVSMQQPAPGAVVQRGSVLSLQLSSPQPELPAPPLASDLAQVIPPPPTAAAEKMPAPPRRGQDG